MKPTKEKITPKKAAEMLATNEHNRPLRRATVSRYAREMKMGNWVESPEPIIFDEKGALVNGQHRLTALIEADHTADFWVVRGMPHQHVDKLDGGDGRALWEKLTYYSGNRAVARLTEGAPGRARQMASIVSFIYKMLTGQSRPSTEEALRIVHYYNQEISDTFEMLCSDKLMRRGAAMTAFVVAMGSAKNRKERKSICNLAKSARDGEMLERGDPAYVLRVYLQSCIHPRRLKNGSKFTARGAVDSEWIVFVKTLRCIQAELDGEKISKLTSPRGRSRELIESFIGPTVDFARELKLGTREMRKALAEEAAQESASE